MDSQEVECLKIVQILPEFHEGGVERHVLWLSNELAEMGHEVAVISAGGKLEEKLDERVALWKLPVQKKNPATALYSAIRIACRAKSEGWEILHAHSRVPAWIAWWASGLSGLPWILTAHSIYSLNAGLIPFSRASAVICVTDAVKEHLADRLPDRSVVIPNGLPLSGTEWSKRALPENPRFLFIGRLTSIKGLQFVIEALGELKMFDWRLDVVGDGPQREELELMVRKYGLDERVIFHGTRDDVQDWMRTAGCLLFPSLSEGMGLSFLEAVQMGLPVIASNLEPVRQMAFENAVLVNPGDTKGWVKALKKALVVGVTPGTFDQNRILTIQEMTNNIEKLYDTITNGNYCR